MDNKFCRNCGQANFPNANVCSKCGQAFSVAANNPFNQQPTRQPQMAQAPPSPPSQPKKKSNKKFWIIGGIAAFLIFMFGAILLAAVGIFIYTSQGDDTYITENQNKEKSDDSKTTPDPKDDKDSKNDFDSPLSDIDFPKADDTDFGGGSDASTSDSELMRLFKEKKSRIGIFTLNNVAERKNDGTFPGRVSGAIAYYSGGGASITHEVYLYTSVAAASKDFSAFRRVLSRLKVKFRSNKSSQVVFETKGKVYLGFRNPQGGIHVIGSRDGRDVLKYYNAFFYR